MGKEGNTALQPLWRELFSVARYKRSQGKIARQVTFVALALLLAVGAWTLAEGLTGMASFSVRWGVAGGLLAAGLWFCFRIVNYSPFADFLIAVEAEMNKVSWPGQRQLVLSSIVVVVTMFGLAIVLLAFDVFWQRLLSALRIIG